MQVVARGHRHAVGPGRLDRQQVAAAGALQSDVFVEPVGRFAGRADDRVLLLALRCGGDVLDVVVGAVEGGADEFGHRGVADHQPAPGGGGLVEEHRRDEFAALGHDGAPEFEVYFAAAHAQVVVDDREERGEVGDRLIFRHVVVDAQAAAHIDEAEREAESFEVLDDPVHLVAHVLEDVQFADLRTDVQVDADDAQVGERLQLLGMFENLLVGDAELAVGLPRIDASVRFGVDIGVDAQRHVGRAARLGREAVDRLQLFDRLAVDRQDALFDGVAQLLVALSDPCVDDRRGVEARLDRLAQLVAAGAVDAEAVLADRGEQVVVVVGLDGVVEPVAVFVRLVDDAFERLPQQGHVVEVEGRLVGA